MQIGKVCTEVNTFITLSISTDIKKGRGPNELSLGFLCVFLETGNLVKKLAALL